MAEVRVLLGLHEALYRRVIEMRLELMGYQFDSVGPNQFLNQLGTIGYSGILMDLNHGNPASLDISPSQQAYDARGDANFLGVSGSREVISRAKEAGIPCALKDAMNQPIYDFLDGLG
jgi:hypothetical protein